MIWAIDNDDFVPECSNIRYPLLRAINSEFKAASSGSVVTQKPKDDKGQQDDKKGPTSGNSGIKGISINLLVCVLIPVIFTFSFLH
jgi:chitinase